MEIARNKYLEIGLMNNSMIYSNNTNKIIIFNDNQY